MATGKKQTESEMLAEKLLQGWTMLSENCPYCSRVPLMRQRQGKDWCVACSRFAPTNPAQQQQQQQQQQQKQQDEEEDETSDSGSEKSERLASATGEPFELRGSFRLQATPEERLAACSAALKREGEAAAEALKQQHQQQQQQQECSPASTTAESVSTPSEELLRWGNEVLGSRRQQQPQQQQQLQQQQQQQPQRQQQQQQAGPPDRKSTLHQSKAILLTKVQKYNGMLQAETGSIERDFHLLAALKESLEALKILETMTQ